MPEDALPEDLMSNWSQIPDLTAEEYAAEKGLTIVCIGGGIVNTDELGIVEQSMDFLSVSEDAMRLQSDFVLQDTSTTTTSTYLCGSERKCIRVYERLRCALCGEWSVQAAVYAEFVRDQRNAVRGSL